VDDCEFVEIYGIIVVKPVVGVLDEGSIGGTTTYKHWDVFTRGN